MPPVSVIQIVPLTASADARCPRCAGGWRRGSCAAPTGAGGPWRGGGSVRSHATMLRWSSTSAATTCSSCSVARSDVVVGGGARRGACTSAASSGWPRSTACSRAPTDSACGSRRPCACTPSRSAARRGACRPTRARTRPAVHAGALATVQPLGDELALPLRSARRARRRRGASGGCSASGSAGRRTSTPSGRRRRATGFAAARRARRAHDRNRRRAEPSVISEPVASSVFQYGTAR